MAGIVVWLTIGALSVELLALCARVVSDFPMATDAGYPDSALVVRVAGLLSQGDLFPPLDRPPYLVTVYGPLTYVVLSAPFAAARALGVDPVLGLRIAEVALFVACLVLIAILVRHFTRSAPIVLLAILLAAAGEPLRPWVLQLRGDFLGLLLSLTCIALCVRTGSGRSLTLAAVLAGLAILSKQTFVAAPAAVVLWLLWQKEWRTAAVWAGTVAAVVGVGYGIVLVREPSLLGHVAALRMPVFEYWVAAGFVVTAVVHIKVLYGVAGAAVLFRSSDARARLVVGYWAASWIVAIGTIPQIGGNMNYLWEPWFVSALLAALAIDAAVAQAERIPGAVAVALVLLHVRVLTGGVLEAGDELRGLAAARARAEQRDTGLRALGSAVQGYAVLSSSPYLARMSRVPVLPDPYLTSILVQTGAWDPAPVLASVRNGAFDVVVGYDPDDRTAFRRHRQWNPLVAAAGHPYRVACTLHGHAVWLAASSPAALRQRLAAMGCQSGNPAEMP
jgi:hypothetical protein